MKYLISTELLHYSMKLDRLELSELVLRWQNQVERISRAGFRTADTAITRSHVTFLFCFSQLKPQFLLSPQSSSNYWLTCNRDVQQHELKRKKTFLVQFTFSTMSMALYVVL